MIGNLLRISAAKIIFTMLSILPSRVYVAKFLPIHDVTLIKIHKTSPPFIAFEELSRVSQTSDYNNFQNEVNLMTALRGSVNRPLFTVKLELNEEVIKKEIQQISTQAEVASVGNENFMNYFEELTNQQKLRLKLAQNINPIEIEPTSHRENVVENTKNNLIQIQGPLEIFGGLAVTNEHHFEVRHKSEGVAKEVGTVNLKDGTYTIQVENTQGSIIAGLYDSSGKLVGESSARVSTLSGASSNGKHVGPKLNIRPQPTVSGNIASIQGRSVGGNNKLMKIAASMFNGDENLRIEKDGSFEAASISKGSTSIMEIASQGFVPYTKILFSGHDKNISLVPVQMNEAFLQIVLGGEYRGSETMNDYSLAWGKVQVDGKALSGVELQLENDNSAKVIYFNELYLPDESLKKTSSLGLFAILSSQEGLASIVAQRTDAYFSHKNIILKKGIMAEADIEASIKTEPVVVRAFDAFLGSPIKAELEMQSLSEPLELENGSAVVQLPFLNRWSLLMVQPSSNEYIPALYSYFDNQSYIHLPLIKESWLRDLRLSAHLDDSPFAGVAVGFIPDEDFEVFMAGKETDDQPKLVYFNSNGQQSKANHGTIGGGFVIYNLQEGTHEVIVTGKASGKIHSRLYSIDKKSVTISNFNND